MDGLQLLLDQHAGVHTAALTGASASLADRCLSGLSDDQLRLRPDGHNSIAWLLWHMARTEDVALNALVAGRPQVIDGDGWLERLGVARCDIGTAMTDDQVADFSTQVNIAALRAYREATGRRTREIMACLRAEELGEAVDDARLQEALAQGALAGEQAQWVGSLWQGRPKVWFLSWVGAGHNYVHLGEAQCVRHQAGLGLGL